MWRCGGCGVTDEDLCENYENCDTDRVCVECDNVYFGGIECTSCGGASEPLDLDQTVYDDLEEEK